MTGSLLSLWQNNAALIRDKTFRQIIQFSGEGRLSDGNETSREILELLAAVPLEQLSTFAEECLTASFQDSGFALQDTCNQVGVRLGYRVEFGRYRGVRNEIGFDGLWRAKDGHALLVEVKTTDAYRINLDKIAQYRDDLIDAGDITERSSILIIVGRQDTGDLEAQIRGSKHAWDVRLISVDSLFRLATVKEQMSDWATSTKINQVLQPMEYTRLDQIIDLLFETSKDIEEGDQDQPEDGTDPDTDQPKTRTNLEPAREAAAQKASAKLGQPLIKKGRALRSTSDGRTNVVCLASQQYDGPAGSTSYWYGFTQAQSEFIQDADDGWVVFACQDSPRVLMINRDEFLSWLPEMLTTPPHPADPSEIRHWHIYFYDYRDRIEMIPRKSEGERRNVIAYALDPD